MVNDKIVLVNVHVVISFELYMFLSNKNRQNYSTKNNSRPYILYDERIMLKQ